MFIIALLIGCFIGFGFAYMYIGIMVAKSNDHGDSKGTLLDFTRGSWRVIGQRNNISRREI